MPLVFVSCFFPPCGDQVLSLRTACGNKTLEEYLQNFRDLAESHVPLILYVTEGFKAFLVEQLPELLESHSNVTIKTHLEVEPYFLHQDLVLPQQRWEVKDTAFFFSCMLTKFKACADAGRFLQGNEEDLAWIDFGIFHVFRDKVGAQEKLRQLALSQASLPSEKLLSGSAYKVRDLGNLWNSVTWQYLGGLVVGKAASFVLAYERQKQLVEEHFPRLTWEVNYWVMMEDLFDTYPADHDNSMVDNLYAFLHSPCLPCTPPSLPQSLPLAKEKVD